MYISVNAASISGVPSSALFQKYKMTIKKRCTLIGFWFVRSQYEHKVILEQRRHDQRDKTTTTTTTTTKQPNTYVMTNLIPVLV